MSNNRKNALIIAAVLVGLMAVVFAKAMKNKQQGSCCPKQFVMESNLPADQVTVENEDVNQAADQNSASGQVTVEKAMPLMMELGSDSCKPCQMMMPILEQLRNEYGKWFKVEFVDVWKFPQRARKYNIEYIPVQIFFDADNKELFRHVGFFPKEEIISKWKELGFNLEAVK